MIMPLIAYVVVEQQVERLRKMDQTKAEFSMHVQRPGKLSFKNLISLPKHPFYDLLSYDLNVII